MCIRDRARDADLAALLRLGRVPRARAREVARHLAGSVLPLQLLPRAGERRLVALHRGAVLPGGPAAPSGCPPAPRSARPGVGAHRAAGAHAGGAGADAPGSGPGRVRPDLRTDPHPLRRPAGRAVPGPVSYTHLTLPTSD